MSINLRTATSEDFGFLFHLHKITQMAYIEAIWGWNEENQLEYHRTSYGTAETCIIQLDDEDIGVLSLIRHDGYIFMQRLEILPEYQRRGIGSQIIRFVVEQASEQEKSVSLHVFKSNPAHELYEDLGFYIVSETETHYRMLWESDFTV